MTGSGAFPPVATYFYRQSFISNIDFVFDEDQFDIVCFKQWKFN